MIPLLLTRWRDALGLFAGLALLGALLAANHYRHAYHSERALRQADRAAYGQAQIEAQANAYAARAKLEQSYQEKARAADNENALAVAAARSAGDRYIAAHRVRTEAVASTASGTDPTGQDHGAGLPAGMPADAVVVGADDVQACSALYPYAIKARDWALSIGGEQ